MNEIFNHNREENICIKSSYSRQAKHKLIGMDIITFGAKKTIARFMQHNKRMEQPASS